MLSLTMQKIVLDTCVFVSALLGPSGASRAALRACLEKRCLPLMGNALFLEYEDLPARDRLFAQCGLDGEERGILLDAFLSTCQWVTVYYGWRPNLKDEADNHLVELAVAGGADFLVTKNIKDFQNPELSFDGLRIIDPVTLLKEVEPWQP
jgi:putative PIN family toxin of toxin-antitoxin system